MVSALWESALSHKVHLCLSGLTGGQALRTGTTPSLLPTHPCDRSMPCSGVWAQPVCRPLAFVCSTANLGGAGTLSLCASQSLINAGQFLWLFQRLKNSMGSRIVKTTLAPSGQCSQIVFWRNVNTLCFDTHTHLHAHRQIVRTQLSPLSCCFKWLFLVFIYWM